FVGMIRAALDGNKQDMHELMIDLGYLANDFTLKPHEAYQWVAEVLYEALVPQPVTFTGDTSQRAVHALLDIRAPDHPLRRISFPDDLLFFSRINLGINMICATLRTSVHIRSIMDDMDGVAEPITPLGKLHDAWVRDRGLPYGLEPHDHP
ncbi:MAG: AarF/ABC1/UbiB kinase family protein, partial [Mycobacterium sp.]